MQNDKIATSDLRPRAENEVREKEQSAHPSDVNVGALYHELDVYKIELGEKNEKLMRAQAKLVASEEKYRDLYEFAPIGYFTSSLRG